MAVLAAARRPASAIAVAASCGLRGRVFANARVQRLSVQMPMSPSRRLSLLLGQPAARICRGQRSFGAAALQQSAPLTPPVGSFGTAASTSDLLQLLAELRIELDPGGHGSAKLESAEVALQAALGSASTTDRLALLQDLARLGALPGRPYPVTRLFLSFLENYGEELETLRDGETIAGRANELREVLRCFHLAGVNTERLRMIYTHIERDFPRIEASGAILPMPDALRLCHLMLSTDLSSPQAIIVLLRATLREPLMHFTDDSVELRLLKMVEMLLRVDFLTTQEQLPRDVTEYLSVVRSLRYYDRDLRRDTALSYQLAFFLRKHSFPCKREMVGPYALKVCDPKERVNFEPVEERTWRSGMREEPPARKRRHLEAVGWRYIEVHAADWHALETYEAKAAHVRQLLKDHDLLDK